MKTRKMRWSISPILVVLTLSETLSDWSKATAQEAVFVVSRIRAARFESKKFTDEEQKKAQTLSRMLMDAYIDVSYAMDHSSPVQTAELVAKTLNIAVNKISWNPAAIDDWVRRLPTEYANQRVLVVTGGPGPMTGEGLRILKGLGVSDKDIWSRRSDHLMVIVPRGGGEPLVIKMRW